MQLVGGEVQDLSELDAGLTYRSAVLGISHKMKFNLKLIGKPRHQTINVEIVQTY